VCQFTPGDDIAATLSRHGVRVETSTFRGKATAIHASARESSAAFRALLKELPFPLLLVN
jgi:hypothetical protein